MSEEKPKIKIDDPEAQGPPPPPLPSGEAMPGVEGAADLADLADLADPADPTEAQVEDEFVDLAKRCSDLESKLLRAHADYQNVIRRSHQEVANAREHQVMDIAKDLLTVLDHFDHALAIDPEQSSAQDVLNGVMIVRDELTRTLERYDIQKLTVEAGEEFDPNRHEALMRQPAEDLDTNQVVMQLQPGYLIKDKTLRPAKVSVAE